ncbi:Lmo0850 family protein [Bacillus ndiopicus]|nr:Lmo0850 family protein [Bacillus ndiopicus]
MAKEIDLKKIVSNLSKLGVNATVTKSRIELLKVLTPPTQSPQAQQA